MAKAKETLLFWSLIHANGGCGIYRSGDFLFRKFQSPGCTISKDRITEMEAAEIMAKYPQDIRAANLKAVATGKFAFQQILAELIAD